MIQKGDFVELNFTARIASNDSVFDTTVEDEAKKHNIYSKEITYKPLVACIGESQLIPGLDDYLIGKDIGKHTAKIENAFGKKNAKLLRLVSIKEFHKNKINPMPGLEVDLDGERGLVRTVNGGRVIVDFNHPLASQDIIYDVDIKGTVEDEAKKAQGILDFLKIPFKDVKVENEKATVLADLPEQIHEPLSTEIKRLTKIKEVEFRRE